MIIVVVRLIAIHRHIVHLGHGVACTPSLPLLAQLSLSDSLGHLGDVAGIVLSLIEKLSGHHHLLLLLILSGVAWSFPLVHQVE